MVGLWSQCPVPTHCNSITIMENGDGNVVYYQQLEILTGNDNGICCNLMYYINVSKDSLGCCVCNGYSGKVNMTLMCWLFLWYLLYKSQSDAHHKRFNRLEIIKTFRELFHFSPITYNRKTFTKVTLLPHTITKKDHLKCYHSWDTEWH